MLIVKMDKLNAESIVSVDFEPEELYNYNTTTINYREKKGVLCMQCECKVDTLLKIEPCRKMLVEIAGSLDVKRMPAMSNTEPDYTKMILLLNFNKYEDFIDALYDAYLMKDKNKKIVEQLLKVTDPKEIYLTTYLFDKFKEIYYNIGSYPSVFRVSFNLQDENDYEKFLDQMLFVPENFRRIYPTIEFLRTIQSAYDIFQVGLGDPYYFGENDMEPFERYDYPDYNLVIGCLCDFLEC